MATIFNIRLDNRGALKGSFANMAAIRAKARKRAAFGARDQQLIGYQELAKAAQRDRDRAQADAAAAKAEAKDATARLAGLRDDIAALKGELALAYANIERQAGYLDRVHESDLLEDRPQYELPKVERRPGPRAQSVERIATYGRVLNVADGERFERVNPRPWWAR